MDQIVVACAGGLIAGESALLLFGMNFPSITPWSTARNIVLAVTDIILGALMVCISVFEKKYLNAWPFYAAVAVLLSTHLYREVEHLGKSGERFIINSALFVFNNIRIGLLVASLGVAARHAFPKILAIL
jgi:hypothetical protein